MTVLYSITCCWNTFGIIKCLLKTWKRVRAKCQSYHLSVMHHIYDSKENSTHTMWILFRSLFNSCVFITMTLLTSCASRATAQGAGVAAGQRGRPDLRPRPCQLRQDPGPEEGQEASWAGKVGAAPAGAAGSAVNTGSGYSDGAGLGFSLGGSAGPRGAAGACVQRISNHHDEQWQLKHCTRQFRETWFVSGDGKCVTDTSQGLMGQSFHSFALMHVLNLGIPIFGINGKKVVQEQLLYGFGGGGWHLDHIQQYYQGVLILIYFNVPYLFHSL